MSNPFDYVKEILQSKNNLIVDEQTEKDYNPFIVNRALSYHLDCLPYVAEISALSFLEKDMQYQYLLNTIRPMKRPFHKWQKAEKLEDLECVKLLFGYSDKKAKEALRVLTDEQLTQIRKRTEKGGMKKE